MTGRVSRRVAASGELGERGRIDPLQGDPANRDAALTLSPAGIARNRRTRRDASIARVLQRLDAEPDPVARRQIMEWIDEHYASREGGVLLGLMARCHLGAPYVDHALTVTGFILEHYAPADPVPPAFAVARRLASNAAYEYIEVYSDGAIVPIRIDGTPAA